MDAFDAQLNGRKRPTDDNQEEDEQREGETFVQSKRRKANEKVIKGLQEMLTFTQKRINSYEAQIKANPELQSTYDNILTKDRARIPRLEQDIFELQFKGM